MASAEERIMSSADTLGSSAAMQYWNDFVAVYMNSNQRIALLYSAYWQRVVACGLSPDELQRVQWEFYRELWQEWQVLSRFPSEWFSRWIGDVPEVVFYVDPYMEATPQEEVALHRVVDGLSVQVTDLQLVTAGVTKVIDAGAAVIQPGSPTIPSSLVQVKVLDGGSRARVGLIELLVPPSPDATGNDSVPVPKYFFQYVGGAFTQEGQTRRPLFTIRVILMPLWSAGASQSKAPRAIG